MASSSEKRTTRAPLAALFSVFVPGWGHAYAGQKRHGYALFLVNILLFVSALFMLARIGFSRLELVKLWVTPSALIALMVINLVIFTYRGHAVIGSYRAVPDRSRPGVSGGVGLVLVATMLVLPHLGVGYYTWTQFDMITTVFSDDPIVAAPSFDEPPSTTTTSTTEPEIPSTFSSSFIVDSDSDVIYIDPLSVVTTTTTTTTTTVPRTTGTTRPRATTTTVRRAPPTTQPRLESIELPDAWDGSERLNLLLLGSDAGPGRYGARTDSITVISVDPATGETAMFSLPRNLGYVPLPDGMGIWACKCFPDILGHLYAVSGSHPAAFPGPNNPRINAVKGAVGQLLGLPIHHYAMVTLNGFVQMIDAVGGVEIKVPKTITDSAYPHHDGSTVSVTIKAGDQLLDGHHALAYSRIRKGSNDYARMHRQRCVLGALVNQTSAADLLLNFGAVAGAIKENVSTDIPQGRLPDLVEVLSKVSTNEILSLRIASPYITGLENGKNHFDLLRIRTEAQLIVNDPGKARSQLNLGNLSANCNQSFD